MTVSLSDSRRRLVGLVPKSVGVAVAVRIGDDSSVEGV